MYTLKTRPSILVPDINCSGAVHTLAPHLREGEASLAVALRSAEQRQHSGRSSNAGNPISVGHRLTTHLTTSIYRTGKNHFCVERAVVADLWL